MTRRILMVPNPRRADALAAAEVAREALERHGIEATLDGGADGVEAAIVFGGDGTMLHAAQLVRGTGAPLLGVNLGHVGFLAELEREDIGHAVDRLVAGDYDIDERGTVDVTVHHVDGTVSTGWALNEATVERSDLRRTIDLSLAVDGHSLSSFGCDGIVIATATGSTAHAFSAGGPVIWPDVDALLMVPLAAHALFARPLVIGPRSVFGIEVLERSDADCLVVLDGARSIDVARGGRIEVRVGEHKVRLARTSDAPFTERLVRKFALPTLGWRGGRTSAPHGEA